ncbi:MAG: hypothetical protein U0987_03635 [Afipia sp.]|nr:hypothetical protein [Afipia sp.]
MESVTGDQLIDAKCEPAPLALQCLDDWFGRVDAHDGERVCLATMRRREQEDALLVVIETTQPHDLALADKCRDKQSRSQGPFRMSRYRARPRDAAAP